MHIKCSCRLCSTEVFFQKVFGWFVIWTDTLQPARDYSDALTLYLFGDVITGSVQEHGNNVSNQPKFWNFPSSKFGFCSFLKDKLKKWWKPVNLRRNPLFYREASKWAKLQGCKNDFTKSAASWCCSHTEIGTVSKICWLFLTAPPFFLIHINHATEQAVRRICKKWRHIVQAPPTTVDWHHRISIDPALNEPHTIRHVYLHAI